MRGQRVRENQDVFKIDKTKWKITKVPVHHLLEAQGSLLGAKREVEKLKEAKGSNDGSLWDIRGSHGNLEITFLEIKFGEVLGPKDSGREIGNSG